ncbi:GldM family protein [Flavobacterium sp. SUN052]|uniref:GldM family protein n=1 Tax=Flavobacterium sp. SUN052 TaxID=3002441 RepID=UPI00237E8A6B|nr:GldM family protein [Flavobacterium sp. SUN052]MEC4003544.1 GldM family protein [Flavobacterium sp. SUN052]
MNNKLLILIYFFTLSFYGQNDTISVVHHTDKDFVIPKTAKIVYRGFLNEVYIDVPNSKSFNVEGIGVSKIGKNIFTINPSCGTEVIINISGVLKNGNKFSEKQIFSIRNFPNLQMNINNLVGFHVRMQKKSLLNAVIKGSFPDKNIGLNCTIKSFELKVPGYNSIHIDGSKIKEIDYNKIINRLKIGDEIVISDIRFSVNINALICKTNSIIVEIY